MNKKLIVLSIAAAMAAPLAAQAGVEIYGQAHVSADYNNNNDNRPGYTKSNGSLSSDASRLGLKGDEDLGNGLSAMWTIEQNVDFDTGNAFNFARQTFVGVGGGFGTVVGGRLYTPYRNSTAKYDVFRDTKADYNAIMGSADGINAFTNRAQDSLSNVIAYMTPDMNGFSASAAYVLPSVLTQNDNLPLTNPQQKQDAYSLSAGYDVGPLSLTAAYETLNKVGYNLNNGTAKAWKAGGSYTIMNATTLALIYENVDLGSITNIGNTTFGGNRNAIYGSVAHKMGDTTLKLAIANADKLGSGSNNGATQYSLGVAQSLTKNTEVYALYSQINNDNGGAYGFAYGPGNAVTGKDESVFSIGVNHAFSSK